MKGHALSDLEITQQVGKEAALHPIHAHVESISTGRRCDGVGPGLLLAGRVDSQEGNKLSGLKIKVFQLRNVKFKMETRCGF
jgi:hypothetical protein